MARFISTLSLLFVLLVVPALCAGGLLEHVCDCGESVTCGHEDECADDPCVTVTRVEDQDAQANFEYEGPSVQVAILTLAAELAAVNWEWSLRRPQPPDRWNLPYAQSDQPLLL